MLDHQPTNTVLNYIAGGSIVGTMLGWLPHIGALLGIIWYGVLLYDRFFGRDSKRKKTQPDAAA